MKIPVEGTNLSFLRRALFLALLAAAFICLSSAWRLNAANPTSGSITPASSPVQWDGVGAGGTSNGEDTCAEGINCDTFTLTVLGTPADWTGKNIQVDISWVVLASDYDLYIHKCPEGGDVAACNATPPIANSAGGAPATSERAFIEPADLDADGTTVFTIRAVYFAATTGDQYHGSATVVTADGGGPAPTPPPKSPNWNIVYHGTCCEGNLGAAGDNTYVLLPVLATGNIIKKSADDGQTWTQKYPPAPASFPFGIEGDMQAFGDDVIFFGTELATAVVAHSDDAGETFTTVQVPVASGGNDQTWSYLGPFGDLNPAGPLLTDEPYVLAGWFRIGSAAIFSFDGGLTWPIQTPLVGNDGSGPEHVVCHTNAADPEPSAGDTRIANPLFANQKAGRHGAWGTDRKFYWSETVEGTLYTCQTDDFGVNWTGNKHPVAPGPGSNFVVTHTAFDNNGTLYVLHGNKLYVSFNQGKSFAFTHTLPRYGNAGRSDAGSDQFFVADCGTVHLALLEDAGEGRGNVFYLRGTRIDTATPTWDEELVDVVDNVRLDFMQIVLNGNDIPTISYTTPEEEVTTASRNAPKPGLGTGACGLTSVSVVSRKVHGAQGPFNVPLPLDGPIGIEPRNFTDAQADTHEVVFKFGAPVTFNSASVLPGTGGMAELDGPAMFNPATNEVTVKLKEVSNAQIVTVSLLGVAAGGPLTDLAVQMAILLGDINSSQNVESGDVFIVRQENTKLASETNFRSDINANGGVESGDVFLVRRQNPSGLPLSTRASQKKPSSFRGRH